MYKILSATCGLLLLLISASAIANPSVRVVCNNCNVNQMEGQAISHASFVLTVPGTYHYTIVDMHNATFKEFTVEKMSSGNSDFGDIINTIVTALPRRADAPQLEQNLADLKLYVARSRAAAPIDIPVEAGVASAAEALLDPSASAIVVEAYINNTPEVYKNSLAARTQANSLSGALGGTILEWLNISVSEAGTLTSFTVRLADGSTWKVLLGHIADISGALELTVKGTKTAFDKAGIILPLNISMAVNIGRFGGGMNVSAMEIYLQSLGNVTIRKDGNVLGPSCPWTCSRGSNTGLVCGRSC